MVGVQTGKLYKAIKSNPNPARIWEVGGDGGGDGCYFQGDFLGSGLFGMERWLAVGGWVSDIVDSTTQCKIINVMQQQNYNNKNMKHACQKEAKNH